MSSEAQAPQSENGRLARILDGIEKVGNKLPDPAILFLCLMLVVWGVSALLSNMSFTEIDPRTGEAVVIKNLLTAESLTSFLTGMVKTFTAFAPLGVVLVAMLGVGVAEHSGFINTALKKMLRITPVKLITPAVVAVGIISHTATDAGYVVVIPLAGVIFYAVGRHPIAGIMAAFAGVSGGFCANFIPSAIDPLLQSFTQAAAQTLDADIQLNPLNNWFFAASSTLPIIGIIWYLTDKVMEPRLMRSTPLDEGIDAPALDEIGERENKAFRWASLAMLGSMVLVAVLAMPESSTLRDASGSLTNFSAPLMQAIVPLIFIFFVIPGVVFGYANGVFQSSADIIKSMNKAMEGMGAYIVMAFFCSLFIAAFSQSDLGVLLAVKGANFLQSLGMPAGVTIVGMVFLVGFVNLFMGSASAKWALIGPVLVPMLMQLNISPDLSQAAYRIGDSSTNIITPLMPYFPLVVVYCQKYVKNTGIGTLIAAMLPYSMALLAAWTAWLLIYWGIGLPLGLGASYTYGL
ncbi:AbgT putative transporter [Ferrimonas balearica DSM 9799]|uniref:AbgT putative transporter n=1 Tax=Ferrimonas balearica (strain DSM 9799 / CCM 4581 / KCTC 23876 / PAT) TaxID=550540 RepID=E1SV99_FERBD|nr:AbgT family transporter [Ferrimonas balearica]ADN74253.1 AbgT putative transporter [Ferrimonas balearica DSM 9799]MBY5981893.1 AbgT family transporter [Ferrimonas balearica]MBY6019278.1 AbgT family transporter [Halomonas denitrificans]